MAQESRVRGDGNCHLDYNQSINDFSYEGSVKGKEFNYKNFGVLVRWVV